MMPPKLKIRNRIDDHPPIVQLPPTPATKKRMPITLRTFDPKTIWEVFGKTKGKNAPPNGFIILALDRGVESTRLCNGAEIDLEWDTSCNAQEGKQRYWCVYVEETGKVTESRKKCARVLFPIIAPPKAARGATRR